MRAIIDSLDSTIKLDEEFRSMIKMVELLNERVYDITLIPQEFRDHTARSIHLDLNACGYPDDSEHILSILEGGVLDDSIASRLISLRFSSPRPLPWTSEDLSSMHRVLMGGSTGCSPGRIRTGTIEGVPEEFQYYVEMNLVRLLGIVNEAPYPPVISASILWNILMISKPFGDCPLFYAEILSRYLYSRNYRGIARCNLSHILMEHADELSESRTVFVEGEDPNPMLRSTVSCIVTALERAYRILKSKDVKASVDGLSRSIIRNSRRREDFVIADAHQWLGDISDQTFRARVANLIEIGVLTKVGCTKATRYRYVDPFETIRSRCGGKLPHLIEDELQLFYLGVGPIARP